MSTDNVTPIKPGTAAPPRKSRRKSKQKAGLVLRESDEHDGFTTTDVFNALHGVVEALDMKFDDLDIDQQELATAAKVLVCILRRRQES